MNTYNKTIREACVLFTLMASVALHAAEVSENEIVAAARKWIADNAVFQLELPNAVPDKAVQMMDVAGRLMPLWRVDLLPTGYLVMSSDDTLPPVVAFNTNGAYDMPTAHPLPSMLNRQGEIFQEELSKPQTRGNEFAAENQARWNALLKRTRADSVTPSAIITEPLLTTQWDQNGPFNYLCPSHDLYTEHALTGCVPLALAQMLKYHEWPPAGFGTKSYTDNEGAMQGMLKADYSAPYDWNVLQDSYDKKQERDYGIAEWAVARLVMEMGVLAEADYELDCTLAFSHNLHTLMAQHLGYSNTAVYGDSRKGYGGYVAQSTLYSRIHADMVAGRPAFVSYEDHLFMADGLGTMGNLDYYHFNFGWGGYQDGWYLLTDGIDRSVVVTATTNITPEPVAVFRPMSVEQPSSFTLSWDFPKRLTAEAFRLTKTTGNRSSTVVSSSIPGTDRSYTLTEQSGTAAYTLEAKVDGRWCAMSDSVTVTVKNEPIPMLELALDDELKSVAGKQLAMPITANHSLSSLTVTSNRPDILPANSITVSGSGESRTMQLAPKSGAIGNVLLYVTATDSVGNTARRTVLLRIMADETLAWHTSCDDAVAAATKNGTYILLVAGLDDCEHTNYFRQTICETGDIKAEIQDNYTLWYCDCDQASLDEYSVFVDGLGKTFPLIAIIDTDDLSGRQRGHGGPMTIEEARTLFNQDLPYFSLDDNRTFAFASTQSLELSVLRNDAVVYYRLDAQPPTTSDLLYSSPIQLTSDTTVSARAFKDDMPIGDAVTKTYHFETLAELPAAQAIVTDGDVTMHSTTTPWTLQTTTYNSPDSAMQSGRIDHNASSSLVAKVNGSGQLSFHWRSSSEADYDKLSFAIDGATETSISGVTEWKQENYAVTGSGDHYFTWTYQKDSSGSANDDCGWVDDIVWISDRKLVSIEIVDCITVIGCGENATYYCKATWSDGTVTAAKPVWSLSMMDHASVDANGKVTNQNLTIDDQTVTLNASLTSYKITKTAAIDITLKGVPKLELLPGWNLVTLQKHLKSTPPGMQKFLALRPIILDANNRCYIQCDHEADVKTGVGYWVFSGERKTVELEQDIEQTVSQPELKSGWNLVGFLEDSDWATSDVEVWSWRNSRFVYIDKQDLQIGQAYWVFR